MLRLSPVWVVFAALTACYSPSFRPCELGCESGLCPSGYQCEQGVDLCRPVGQTESCTTLGQDAQGSGSDAIVTSDRSDNSGFCAGYPMAIGCHDFDNGGAVTDGWSYSGASGGTVSFTTSTQSPPAAFASQLNPNNIGNISEARMGNLRVPSNATTQISVAWEMRIVERANPNGVMELFSVKLLGVNNSFYVTVRSPSNGGGIEVVHSDGGATASQVAVAPGAWIRWELVFSLNPVTAQASVTAFRDDAMFGLVGPNAKSYDPGSTLDYAAGLFTSQMNGIAHVDYDNVLVTVQ